MNNTISFYSVRNRGLTADMQLIKQSLSNYLPDSEYRFYIKNEINNNPKVTQMVRRSRLKFTKDTGHAICIDESIPKKFPEGDYVRLFVAEPFDYMFKNYTSNDSALHNRDAFSACTHILTGIPVIDRMTRKNYDCNEITIINDTYMPLTWDIMHSNKRINYRNKLEYYYPDIKGKKIILLLMIGNMEDEQGNNLFENENILEVLNRTGDKWYILYNSPYMAKALRYLPTKFKKQIGYTAGYLTDCQLLYVADLLVTNNGKHAVNYAGIKKPVYCMNMKNNGFTTYMNTYFPELCFAHLEELVNVDFSERDLNKYEQSFYRETSPNKKRNPFVILNKLFS